MKSLFDPAVAVMSRLRYPQKFALITLLFALPLGVAMFFFFTEVDHDLQFSGKERLGCDYNRQLTAILRDIQEHHALNLAVLAGDTAASAARGERRGEVDRGLKELEAFDQRYTADLASTPRLRALREKWEALTKDLPSLQTPAALSRHAEVMGEVISLITHIGDTSNLILDPDLDSYYLMDATVSDLPLLMSRLDQLRSLGLTTEPDKLLTFEEQGAFSNAAAVIASTVAKHVRGMEVAFGANPGLRDSLAATVNANVSTLKALLGEIDTRILKPERFGIPRPEFVARLGDLLGAQIRLYERGSSALSHLIGDRLRKLENRKALVGILSAIMVVLVSYVYAGFYVSVRKTVDSLRAVSERLVAGEKSRAVTPTSRDELGEVAVAFNAVATALSQANASMQQEIAQRKVAEDTVRESEDRVRRTIDSALDAVVTMNEEGVISEWSPQAERTFGWTRTEVIGRRLSDYIIPPKYREAHEEGLKSYLRTGVGPVLNKRVEISALHKDGREFPVEVAITPITFGKSVLFSAFVRDITDRKRAQEELRVAKDSAEQANRAKSQFLANMSHELRTPLNSVIGFANILIKKRDNAMPPLQISYLERILANGKHLLELINEVLDLSKIEAGKMELEHAPTDIGALVRDTVAQMEGRVAGRDIALLAEIPDDLKTLETDAGKLKQILINLLGNALKFTEQGSVTVRVRPDSRSRPRRIDVVDTGIGIPKERQTAIFEAFQQADNTTSRKYGGTGLGLTITRSLCQLMGFSILVESEVGKGSTFSVLLAGESGGTTAHHERNTTAIIARARTPAPDAPVGAPGQKVVLVIDDEADSRTLISEYVRECGCLAIAADSGKTGLTLAEKHRPDLITLDLLMPGMSGWEVLRLLKASPSLRNIPVIIISIIARESRGTLLGAIDAVAKPFAREDLADVLRRNLRDGRGKVLIVDDSEDARRILRTYLAEEPVEIAEAADGEAALRALEAFPANLVILDLLMPVMDGMEFLEKLRQDPRFGQIPVVVVTAQDLSEESCRQLVVQSASVIRKGGALEESVKRALHAILAPSPQKASP